MNNYDSVARIAAKATAESSTLFSKIPANYYFTHSILANLGKAVEEASKFSPGNIVWSDATPSTDTGDYFNSVANSIPDGTNPNVAINSYLSGNNYRGVKGHQWNLVSSRQ